MITHANQMSAFKMVSSSLVVCALCVVSTGCKTDTAPSAGMGDPYPAPMNDPQISMLSPELREHIVFQPAIITKDGQRAMTVEVPMRNTTYNKYLLEYRYLFYDASGRELGPVMGWKFTPLDPKQVVRLKESAPAVEADNYRLEVRWSR
jgi:uncharacterized protein YcfL